MIVWKGTEQRSDPCDPVHVFPFSFIIITLHLMCYKVIYNTHYNF